MHRMRAIVLGAIAGGLFATTAVAQLREAAAAARLGAAAVRPISDGGAWMPGTAIGFNLKP